MDVFVKQVLEWPVIIQGALGSALFAFILYLGQKVSYFISVKISNLSRQNKINALLVEKVKYQITQNENEERSAHIGILVYGALKSLTLGFILITLGLAFETIIPIFGLVGYLGALIYLFEASRIFRPINTADVNVEMKIKEIDEEIAKLKKHKTNFTT
jgi:hypothetical protein